MAVPAPRESPPSTSGNVSPVSRSRPQGLRPPAPADSHGDCGRAGFDQQAYILRRGAGRPDGFNRELCDRLFIYVLVMGWNGQPPGRAASKNDPVGLQLLDFCPSLFRFHPTPCHSLKTAETSKI
jgi:hypothetical protein